MDLKKSPKVDLEKKKGIFFEIGLLFALGILFFAFEWKSDNLSVSSIETNILEMMEEEVVPVTMHEVKLPPPPPPAPPVLLDVFELIEDIDDIDDVLTIIDADDDSENNPIVDQEWGDYEGEDTGEATPFLFLEERPYLNNFNKWLEKNLRYPEAAQMNNIQGKVIVEFIVEKDGSISNAKILRSVDPLLDKEALRVVNSMPKWVPGKQRKKPVRTTHQLPIGFYLN